MNVSFSYSVKQDGKYVETYRTEDPATVYEKLATELIAKKINECTWIKSITRVNLFDGTQQITMHYWSGDLRAVGRYIVKN